MGKTEEQKNRYLRYRERTPPLIPFIPYLYKRMPLWTKRLFCFELPMYEYDPEQRPCRLLIGTCAARSRTLKRRSHALQLHRPSTLSTECNRVYYLRPLLFASLFWCLYVCPPKHIWLCLPCFGVCPGAAELSSWGL